MKKSLLLFTFTVLALCSSSPFPSTVEGIEIPNTHVVDEEESTYVLRGQAPRNEEDVAALRNFGIEEVLIFKNETHSEVQEETQWLLDQGMEPHRIHSIPFRWKNLPSFSTACRQTMHALRILSQAVKEGRSLYFHCTVGEDRTGYLSGLYHFLFLEDDLDEIFTNEMCRHGYEAGNPKKPYGPVVKPIREELTPLFLKMAYKIAQGEISPTHLSDSVCNTDPEDSEEFSEDPDWASENYECETSPLFD